MDGDMERKEEGLLRHCVQRRNMKVEEEYYQGP